MNSGFKVLHYPVAEIFPLALDMFVIFQFSDEVKFIDINVIYLKMIN